MTPIRFISIVLNDGFVGAPFVIWGVLNEPSSLTPAFATCLFKVISLGYRDVTIVLTTMSTDPNFEMASWNSET